MEAWVKIFNIGSGLLIGSDLIMAKNTMTKINRRLRNCLRLSTKKKTFIVSIVVAVVGIAGWITDLILKDSSSIHQNISWLLMFSVGFAVGLIVLLFSTNYVIKFFKKDLSWSIAVTGMWLGIISVIIFLDAVKSTGNSPFMHFALGLFYGVASVDISLIVSKYINMVCDATAPNPDDDGNPRDERNPRVLARLGLLLFIIAGFIDLGLGAFLKRLYNNTINMIERSSPTIVSISTICIILLVIGIPLILRKIVNKEKPLSTNLGQREPIKLMRSNSPAAEALRQKTRPRKRVTLSDLVSSGFLPSDAELEVQIYGIKSIGQIRNGKIEVSGQVFSNPSSASCALRHVRSWNGWIDWQYNGETLAQIRQKYKQTSKPS